MENHDRCEAHQTRNNGPAALGEEGPFRNESLILQFLRPSHPGAGKLCRPSNVMPSVLPPILAGSTDVDAEGCPSRMASGEETALGFLSDQLGGLLSRRAKRITWNEREKVVRDVSSMTWKHARDFGAKRSSPRSGLTMLTRRKSIDLGRMSRCRLPPAPGAFEEFRGVADTSSSASTNADRSETVVAIAADLPPNQRQAMEPAFFDGLTRPDGAALQNETGGTAKARVRLGSERRRRSPIFEEFSAPPHATSLPNLSDSPSGANPARLPPVTIASPFAVNAEASFPLNKS